MNQVLGSLALLLSMSVALAAEPAAPRLDLYLLVGQSNMAGRGPVDAASAQVHPRILALDREGRWQPARDPLHVDKPEAAVGPGLSFARAMADADPQAVIGLIPCAVGGTAITLWTPGTQDPVTKAHPYDDAVRRARLAQRDGVLRGILWNQGEADRGMDRVERYGERLTALAARLRADLDAPQAPFIAAELAVFEEHLRPNIERFNGVIRSLPGSIPRYGFVSAEGFTHKGDQTHLDTRSARELGRRYAVALQAMPRP